MFMPSPTGRNFTSNCPVGKKIAARASLRAERYVFGKVKVATILVDYAGNVLGSDEDLQRV